MNDLPCETTLEESRQDALAHYEELSNSSMSWSSIVPDAINYYYDRKIEERDATQEEAPEKRHFIVSYFYSDKSGNTGFGDCTVTTENGKFLDKKEFIQQSGHQNPVIISIQEISEKDYQDYSSKKED